MPVIAVGNITVGGAGKTPLVIRLVEMLKSMGLRPGVISRGYGGQAEQWPQPVSAGSDPQLVGDEPVLIARRCNCPMWVGPDRPAAAKALMEAGECDIIISDDGMQHYALGRDIEIAVIDAERRLGNGWCLPAGPLRERPGRLSSVDLQVINGQSMLLRPTGIKALANATGRLEWPQLRGKRIHAIAGIGNPDRFFSLLRSQGLEVIEHPFPDHYRYGVDDIHFGDGLPVLMTEKDAVKCMAFAGEQHWFIEVSAELDPTLESRLYELFRGLTNG